MWRSQERKDRGLLGSYAIILGKGTEGPPTPILGQGVLTDRKSSIEIKQYPPGDLNKWREEMEDIGVC